VSLFSTDSVKNNLIFRTVDIQNTRKMIKALK
jgi:hypothetical protein